MLTNYFLFFLPNGLPDEIAWHILRSSGTSAGERKLMPTIQEELERKALLYSLLMPVMNQ